MDFNEDELLPPKVAGPLLGKKPASLANDRVKGRGPEFVKLGGRIYYRRSAIEAYIESNTFSSTSEYETAHGEGPTSCGG